MPTVTADNDTVGAFCGQTGASRPAGFIFDSYVDIETSNQSDVIGNREVVGEDDVQKKQTAEMQGGLAPEEMEEFDFSVVWETVEESDDDVTENGYPILQDIDRQAQLAQQGVFDGLSGDR